MKEYYFIDHINGTQYRIVGKDNKEICSKVIKYLLEQNCEDDILDTIINNLECELINLNGLKTYE